MTTLLFSLLVILALQPVPEPQTGLNFLATAAIGLASSFAWGGAKIGITAVARTTGIADVKVVNFIKPVQPFVVAALAVGLPLLGNLLNITDLPPADVVASAPLSALVGVSARELARRVLVPRTPSVFPSH